MSDIIVRRCSKEDEAGILKVCYKTGYMGEDLTGIDVFNDITLFGYIFCLYYVRHEPHNCFVAVDSRSNEIVGYIIGTSDTCRQNRSFVLKQGWRIILRIILCTMWKYPESLKAIYYVLRNAELDKNRKMLYNEFPAHLHINILPEYQRSGIGGKLIDAFENQVSKTSKGIHLKTSNKNIKAVPFYIKKGYTIHSQKEDKLWKGSNGYSSIVFTKSFI